MGAVRVCGRVVCGELVRLPRLVLDLVQLARDGREGVCGWTVSGRAGDAVLRRELREVAAPDLRRPACVW